MLALLFKVQIFKSDEIQLFYSCRDKNTPCAYVNTCWLLLTCNYPRQKTSVFYFIYLDIPLSSFANAVCMWKNVSFCTKTYIISYIRLCIFIINIWNQKQMKNIELLRKTWFSAVTSICLTFIRAFLFAISDIFAMNILCLGYLYKFDRTIFF